MLLLVTVGVVYNKAGNSISVAISIKFDGENISFDACLIYIYIYICDKYDVTDGVQYVDTPEAHTFRRPLSP